MTGRKSAVCVGKMTGQPLTEYHTQWDAERGADHARSAFGKDLVPYHCNRCGYWHLAPRERQTPSRTCYDCHGGDGRPKAAYDTYDDAERRAAILANEQGVHLRPYECPYGPGWHLTKG